MFSINLAQLNIWIVAFDVDLCLTVRWILETNVVLCSYRCSCQSEHRFCKLSLQQKFHRLRFTLKSTMGTQRTFSKNISLAKEWCRMKRVIDSIWGEWFSLSFLSIMVIIKFRHSRSIKPYCKWDMKWACNHLSGRDVASPMATGNNVLTLSLSRYGSKQLEIAKHLPESVSIFFSL